MSRFRLRTASPTVANSSGAERLRVWATLALGAAAFYDPGFFPDNSGFMLQSDVANVCEQSVLATDPGAGAQAPRDQPVTLVLASPNLPVVVPDLVGLTKASATTVAQRSGLAASARNQELPAGDTRIGLVIAQSPIAGTRLAEGASMQLTIGVATAPTTTTTTTAVPHSSFSRRSVQISSSPATGSSWEVGSSSSSSAGRCARAAAIATRWSSPPDRVSVRRSSRFATPSASATSSTARATAAGSQLPCSSGSTGAVSCKRASRVAKSKVLQSSLRGVRVSTNALPAHQGHGDVQGACAAGSRAAAKSQAKAEKAKAKAEKAKAKAEKADDAT